MAENIFYTFLNENSVFTDKSKISPHYAPEKLPFRDEQIKDLSLWLSPVLKKAKPHNIFVYGKVGTGKTTVACGLASVTNNCVYIDCDVEEPNGHILLKPKITSEESSYKIIPFSIILIIKVTYTLNKTSKRVCIKVISTI